MIALAVMLAACGEYEGTVVTSVLYSSETRSDPIHPNARGYRQIAEAIAQLLKNAGAI